MRAIIFRRVHALNGVLNRILKSSHTGFIHADMTPRGFWPIVKTTAQRYGKIKAMISLLDLFFLVAYCLLPLFIPERTNCT
ncbi:hypothetical protein PUN28_005270 [Cardiocondyla obscurior]|uniref:Uncharacterized protein n=1 Tax=Cardiocondyla obscurior TaxID=286306 RepID=A0AAW2GK57_9HYME